MDISGHEGEMPIPISSSYVGGGGGHGQNQSHTSHFIHHEAPSLHQLKLHQSNGPSPPPPPPPPHQAPTPISVAAPLNSKKGVLVKYRECLKNHAASIGGNATDGCGEFMPCGEEGTLEALKCSACNCHRNFHRKEIDGELSSCDLFHYKGGRKMMSQKGLLISATDPFGFNSGGNNLIPRPSHQMIMPFGAIQTSESDEMEGFGGGVMTRPPMMKKRFRTKFTSEQKEKMLCFAEKMDWRLQKQEESVIQQFCQEIGVKRRVLKVWMHNNKHNLAKKNSNLHLD
ncbi:zinc-finger homeodomain protein 4-like [Phalaenopsis equestris]|uniref:zinc-finger homeodomain protein 4-like n=1 Tax=Phalaenopsis equestris TaxID=78828 RepID=UPI0009E27DC3|nr:zinc-finger homeodomain protein 4-like [Phalaenopsis equestris]